MKDYIAQLIDPAKPRMHNEMLIREYLQEYCLYILYSKKYTPQLAFCGGTALRFLFQLKRFSEYLDFSVNLQTEKPDFAEMLTVIKKEYEAAGYQAEVKYNTKSNVNTAFVKFEGLLYEFGLSQHAPEKISIKFEVDMNPPAGGVLENTMLNRTFMFNVQHFDIASLFAGKVHAAACRQYTKGRDWYDLIWYRTRFPDLVPNIDMLNNALQQSHPGRPMIDKDTWSKLILNALDTMDMKKARQDVAAFLEIPGEIDLLTKENLSNLFK